MPPSGRNCSGHGEPPGPFESAPILRPFPRSFGAPRPARPCGHLDWRAPDGGCVAYPRYLGPDGVEAFCTALVEQAGVLLLPASIYRSELTPTPTDRFRIGIGRRDPAPALEALTDWLKGRR
ncbi:hypothetical protein [Kitasatospora sp. NPDC005751]|uniref:hypothetical protein n=1 Tax=unclassified Kitasatospora TaxID=2633591 RepID=UPI0033EA9B92